MLIHALAIAVVTSVAAPATQPIKIKLGPKTTVFMGPVRPDGTIDYIAALNRKFSKGVMPANNGFVDIANTMGPGAWPSAKFRAKVYRLLGATEPGKGGPYFVPWQPFAKTHATKKVKGGNWAYTDLRGKHYKPASHPVLVAWIKANAPAIAAVERAVAKPNWYMPLVVYPRASPVGVLLSCLSHERSLSRLLCDRATLRWNQGNIRGAWHDLMLARRLTRAQKHRPASLLSQLVAISLDAVARSTTTHLITHSHLSAAQARLMIGGLRSLPAMPSIAVAENSTGRCMALALFEGMHVGRLPPFLSVHIRQRLRGPQLKTAMKQVGRPSYPINWALGHINAGFDLIVATLRIRSYPRMHEQVEKWVTPMKSPKQALVGKRSNRTAHATAKAAIDSAIVKLFASFLAPAIFTAEDNRREAIMDDRMEQVAIALVGYRSEHGHYPAKLGALAPEFLPSIPQDLFIDKPLHYERKADGSVVLYSVGPNMRDDGGKGVNSGAAGADDLVIKLPAP